MRTYRLQLLHTWDPTGTGGASTILFAVSGVDTEVAAGECIADVWFKGMPEPKIEGVMGNASEASQTRSGSSSKLQSKSKSILPEVE